MKKCSVGGCQLSVRIKIAGYCNKHYAKYKKYGDPLAGNFESINKQGTKEYILENIKEEFVVLGMEEYSHVRGPCWIWQRYKNSEGYGRVFYKGRATGAYKLAFLTFGGELSEEKNLVLHTCDVKACCNPDHLYAGNDSDNSIDKVSRGRGPSNIGETNPRAKLKEVEVITIRELLFKGEDIKEIAKTYKVSECTIRDIKMERSWKGIK